VPPGPFTAANQKKIDELALQLRVPTIYASRMSAVRGGLMAYGPSYTDLYRRAAGYVDISKYVGRVNSFQLTI